MITGHCRLRKHLHTLGKDTNRSVEEHLRSKPLKKVHKGTQEGKSKRNLVLGEENSQSNRGDGYGTLSSAETSSHSMKAQHTVCTPIIY